MEEQDTEASPDAEEDYLQYSFPVGAYLDTRIPSEQPGRPSPIAAIDLAQAIYGCLSVAAKNGHWALHLDVSGVDYMSSRYATWLVRKILKATSHDEEYQHIRIVVTGASELVLEQIEDSLVLAKRVAFAAARISDQPRILGELDEVLRASFEAIRNNGPMNALELSEILRVPRPTAANYVERLCRFGLISKVKYRGRKGAAYRYYFRLPVAAGSQ